MGLFYLFLVALALAMDAFTAAICKGLAMKHITARKAVIVGLYFGGFQAVMPWFGYLFGKKSAYFVVLVDHWVAAILLLAIGFNMIKHAITGEEENEDSSLKVKNMVLLAIATSIDAFAIGVAFAFIHVDIAHAMLIIGITTFLLSAGGVKLGNYIGSKFKKQAETAGGVILILLGFKILMEGWDFF